MVIVFVFIRLSSHYASTSLDELSRNVSHYEIILLPLTHDAAHDSPFLFLLPASVLLYHISIIELYSRVTRTLRARTKYLEYNIISEKRKYNVFSLKSFCRYQIKLKTGDTCIYFLYVQNLYLLVNIPLSQ